jgi:hypothetical protein
MMAYLPIGKGRREGLISVLYKIIFLNAFLFSR